MKLDRRRPKTGRQDRHGGISCSNSAHSQKSDELPFATQEYVRRQCHVQANPRNTANNRVVLEVDPCP